MQNFTESTTTVEDSATTLETLATSQKEKRKLYCLKNLASTISLNDSSSISAPPSPTSSQEASSSKLNFFNSFINYSLPESEEHPSSLRKLTQLIHYLSLSEEINTRMKEMLQKKTYLQEEGLDLMEPLSLAATAIGTFAENEPFAANASLLGIFSLLNNLIILQQEIEELVDNGKLIKKINKLEKKMLDRYQIAPIENLERIKAALITKKTVRTAVGILSNTSVSMVSSATEAAGGALLLAGQHALAVPIELASSSTGILSGAIQTGCATRNIYKAIKVNRRIKKIKKTAKTFEPSEVTILFHDYISQEKCKVVKKISGNIANGLGGTTAIVMGGVGIGLLAAGVVTMGVTVPLGIAATAVCITGMVAQYGIIYALDKKEEKKLKKHPHLTKAALAMRLLQLLDRKAGEQSEKEQVIDLFLYYYKHDLRKITTREEQIEQLKKYIIVGLAIVATKDFNLFNDAWRTLFGKDWNYTPAPVIPAEWAAH